MLWARQAPPAGEAAARSGGATVAWDGHERAGRVQSLEGGRGGRCQQWQCQAPCDVGTDNFFLTAGTVSTEAAAAVTLPIMLNLAEWHP